MDRNFTVGDGYAVMILAGQRMGLDYGYVRDAIRQLNGESIHPMIFQGMEGAACAINNRLRKDPTLITRANCHAEQIKAEYGFIPLGEVASEDKTHTAGLNASIRHRVP